MKNTSALLVYSNDFLSENRIVIHPNDGFDIGLMQTTETVPINVKENHCNGSEPAFRCMPGSVALENDCKPGSIQLNPKLWLHIGKPESVVLVFKEDKLFIVNR